MYPSITTADTTAAGGVDDLARDANWFAEVLDNAWSMIGPHVPWWVWPLVITGMTLALVLRAQAGRTLVQRWATGYPLDGVPTTNARMWKRGTRALEDYADTRPGPWAYKPYAFRALVRHGITVWALALVGGFTASAWLVFAGAVVVPLIWAVVRWRYELAQASRWTARWVADHPPRMPRALGAGRSRLALEAGPGSDVAVADEGGAVATADPADDEDDEVSLVSSPREMEQEILWPLWDGVRPALEMSDGIPDHPRKHVKLPRSVDEDDAPVVIKLPRPWQGTADQKARLDHAVKTRLPGEWSVSYKLRGARHTATYKRIPRPPRKVTAEEVFGLIEASKPTAPVFAVGPRMVPVTADLVADSPHLAVSMGSGAGKSTTVKAVVTPMLHDGAEVHILDFKRTSHRWAKGLPNVNIVKEIADIHDALVSLGEEAVRRHRYEDDHEGAEFHRLVVVVEELNSLADELDDYWEQCRASDKDLPKNSPAFKGLSHISYGGRSAAVHLIVVAQKLDARLFGKRSGGAVRENFALRLLARFTKNAWKQLADISPMAKLAKHLGRIAVVSNGEWEEAQVIYWSDKLAREYATSGVVTPASQHAVTAEVIAEETPPTSDVSQDTASHEWLRDTDPRGLAPDGGGRVVEFRRPLTAAPWADEEKTDEDTEETPDEARTLDTFKGIYNRGLLSGVTYDNARQIYRRESTKGIAPAPVQEKPKKLWDVDEIAEWWVDRQAEKSG